MNNRGRGRGRGRGGGIQGRESTRVKKPISIAPYDAPLDSSGNPIAVPMRFEVIKKDGGNAHVTETLQHNLLLSLKRAAAECEVCIDVMGDIQVNSVMGMEHSRWVCNFKVSCKDWQSKLAPFAREFHQKCFLQCNSNDEMPILYTHSKLIYPLRLINMHQNIPFRRIKFGSFINSGEIWNHWIVEGGVATTVDREDGYNFYKDIDGSLEYDRRQITLFFHNRESHPEDDSGQIYLASYKVTINMSSIRKIGFDQSTSKDGPSRRSLVLHVDYAPKIQVKLKNGNNGTWSKFEHRLHICRGIYPGEISNRNALHESKVIMLELDEDFISENQIPSSSSPTHFVDKLVFDILSRLRHKTERAVEYTSYEQLNKLEGKCRRYYDDEIVKVNPYVVRPDFDDYVLLAIKESATELVTRSRERSVNNIDKIHKIQLKAFRIQAVLEGILQRGMDIRCQLLCKEDVWHDFVYMVCMNYCTDEQRTLAVMESLLSVISEGRPHCTVRNLFEKEWNDSRTSHRMTVFTKEEENQGYTRVMKFVQTPSRLIFVGYETIMANRVLTKHSKNGTEIVRISFRDDSGEYMREMSCGSRIMYDVMQRVLMENGIVFAGRRFVWLGNSNSQLRDHGCYLFHESTKTAREVRGKLGNFHLLTSIPKWLARMGQCFTQAKASVKSLTAAEVGVIHDLIGGRDDKGKPYCFSDGVGTISFSHAKDLSDEHSLPRIASAFQIRHKGQKGLVCVDPTIDDRNDLLELMGMGSEKKKVFVRPSMDKFEVDETSRGNEQDTSQLEIVKYSMASPLFLNRPLLNILSQVTEDQSSESHLRMMNRVEELLDTQLRNMAQSLYVEHKAREAIKEMSFPFAMEVFSDANPLKVTSEPFMRALLRANAKFVLQKQLGKMNIRIPSNFGRSMFGVVDPTGVLQYGQVFFQYSSSTSKHMSRSRSNRRNGADGAKIHTGPVMITKNPCIEKGDVRRFEAIDAPGLRHLVDVVVFPMHGHRPHPDEMAGSDLDGDEYSLIWDPQMLFDYNEEASLFPSGEAVENWPILFNGDKSVNIDACEKSLTEFYIIAVTQEQVGVLSNAHLATSDFYGLENKASRSLAKKISQSLDFQKNGIPPEKMTTKAEEDPDDPEMMIPPEKSVRKPDYMEKMRDSGYESRGIMGKVFREIKRYQHAIDWGEEQIGKIDKDTAFDLPGWQRYESAVKREMESYSHGIKCLMEHYGIVSEGELMSGQILSIKNRISEKEADDMNLYNTNQVIEDKVKREITAAREAFFKSIINWEEELDVVNENRKDVDRNSILCRIARSSTNKMDLIRLKAAAAYNICYDEVNKQLQHGDSSIILSFPWVFYDVLSDIKTRPDSRIVRVLPDENAEQSNEPLAEALSEFIDKYCASHSVELKMFKYRFKEESLISKFLSENEGLAKAAFVMVKWALSVGGEMDGNFTEKHLVALFLKLGLGEVMVWGIRRRYIQRPTGEIRVYRKKGEHLLKFIEYVASREFRKSESLSFGDVLPGALIRGEWKPFAESCISSYLWLVTTHQFPLSVGEDREADAIRSAAIIKEFEPRKMELPEDVTGNSDDLANVRENLITISGCTDVQLRPMGHTTEVFVSALGTIESFKKLTEFVVSPSPSRAQAAQKMNANGIPSLVYSRLRVAALGESSLSHPIS